MPLTITQDPTGHSPEDAKRWVQILAKYREPNLKRSLFEIAVTIGPLLAIWALAWAALSVSWALALGLALLNSLFLVRSFMIQHDCGHGAFFANRTASDWVGRTLGVLTATPYDVWRRTHSVHHATAGNLGKRGMGDVDTLTVAEYRARSAWGRLKYRMYRNPIVLFGLGPSYLFLLQNRLPVGLFHAGARYWISAMGTNLSIIVVLLTVAWFGGLAPIVLIYLPTVIGAASIGVWLFFVQHQFEETHWDQDKDWQLHEAALLGSSHYELPGVLRWFSANIGVHHVHHLYSRIPYYRLTEVLRDHRALAESQRMTIRESLRCVRFHLWDETQRRLLSFRAARELYGAI